MAQQTGTTAAVKPLQAAPPSNGQGEPSLADLARGILAREIRPRVSQVRRLAEAVLAAEEKRARKKARKDGGKKRKLARIPGRKAKK